MKKLIVCLAIGISLIACNNENKQTGNAEKKSDSMQGMESKQERNKKVIAASMDAFARRDIDGMVKDAAPDYMDYGDESTPPMKNLDSCKAFIKMLVTSITDYKASNTRLVADGDYVYYFADWSGVFAKDIMGIKASGKPLHYKDCDYFKLNEEGKITEHHSIQNIATLFMSQTMPH